MARQFNAETQKALEALQTDTNRLKIDTAIALCEHIDCVTAQMRAKGNLAEKAIQAAIDLSLVRSGNF